MAELLRIPGFLWACFAAANAFAADDRVVADFEQDGFEGWTVTGEAFGKAPAKGALPGQMAVTGFSGGGLVNGYHGGDDATGKLVSPLFKIERRRLNFLIGGGGFAGETCMNLLLDGKVVRTATGTHTAPGGSERLSWQGWDIADLLGKEVVLEIVDNRKGTWGHVNVDQIVQSDEPALQEIRQEFAITGRYLIWPVTRDATRKQRFFLTLDGEKQPFVFSDIAISAKPDFWVFTDLANFQGRKVTVTATLPPEDREAWTQVKIADTFPGADQLYREPLRPQYHFTSRRGWLNDPNGLVWQDGRWHLFYQHNPYNRGWDNMHWGHATSTDLFHWQEHPTALFPDHEGYMYSGSGFAVSKKQTDIPFKPDVVMGLAYTAEGTRSYVPGQKTDQRLALSTDGGKTFRKYSDQPVVPHHVAENRDPKVFWHEPTKRWIMALYHDGNEYGIYVSPDLVKWERTSTYNIPGDSECPDLFPLAVDGDPKNTRWVAWGANGRYLLGEFDGRTFTPKGGSQRHYFGSSYAGQSYDNAPEGRRIHIGWMRDDRGFDDAPFNLQMSLPLEFHLNKDSKGSLRLRAEPAREIVSLREKSREWKALEVKDGDAELFKDLSGAQFEINAVIDAASSASEIGFLICGDHPAVWRKADQTFTGMEGPQEPVGGKLNVRIFVDTVSMEVFVNGSYFARYLRQKSGAPQIRVVAKDGSVKFDSLEVHTLRSIW